MLFYIKQYTTPKLILKIKQKPHIDYYQLLERIKSGVFYFNVKNIETGQYLVSNKKAQLETITTNIKELVEEELILSYQFDDYETSQVGLYVGEFMIKLTDGLKPDRLVLPLTEILNIKIIESLTNFNRIDELTNNIKFC